MSEQGQNRAEIVERAATALRKAAVPDGPSPELVADTLSAIRERESRQIGGSMRRIMTMKAIMKMAVAASVALFIGLLVWLEPWGSSLAFGDVLQRVREAQSVRFKSLVTQTMPAGVPGAPAGPQTQEATMTIVGDRIRQEMGEIVSVVDWRSGEMLSLVPERKEAMRMRMENTPKELREQNLLERFRGFDRDKGKSIGRKEINGRAVEGFAVEAEGLRMTVWANVETRLPVRVETVMETAMLPKSEVVMEDFEWDVAVDEALMSLEPPAGYEVQTMTVDMSAATEKDLIEGLRLLATWNGGKFPEKFGMAGLQEAVRSQDQASQKEPAAVKEKRGQIVAEMMKISRGLMFVQPTNGDEWHYAGAGAELGDAERPIFWYHPAGAAGYRVIYGDLSVREAAKEDLPDVPAERLPNLPAGGEAQSQ